MRRVAIVLGVLLGVAGATEARAAACCIGAVTAQFGRLGPCETLSAGMAYSLQAHVASWTLDGDLHGVGDTRRLTHTWLGALSLRPHRRLQLGLVMPLIVQGRRVGETVELGGGPGDLRLRLIVEPFEDLPGSAVPYPEVGFAMQLPTGIPVEAAPGVTGAGATGTGFLSLGPTFRLGRTFTSGSLHGLANVLLSAPRPGDLKRAVPGAVWTAALTGSVFVGARGTLALGAGLTGRTPGLVGERLAGVHSVRPWTALGMTVRARRWDRVGVSVRADLPIPKLGRSDEATVVFAVDVAHVSRRALGSGG